MSIRVNPARAGMIREISDLLPRILGKPRASGDDPLLARSRTAGHVNPARAGMIPCSASGRL